MEEYESWQATLDVLEDRQELADIQQGIAELRSGQTVYNKHSRQKRCLSIIQTDPLPKKESA